MDNDVSVTRLPDDDWNERGLPGPGTRFRVVAVMSAVVVGCLVAALVVGITGGGFDEPDERAIVALPEATSGVAGPDTTPTTDVTFTSGNPEGGGTPIQATTQSTAGDETTSTSSATTSSSNTTTATTTNSQPSTEVTTTTPTPSDPPGPDPSEPGRPSDSSQPPSPPTGPPTSTTEPGDDDDGCWWIFCL